MRAAARPTDAMTIHLTNGQGRRLVLALQGLANAPRRALDVPGLLAMIQRLGFVQLDSIQTVARAHHMILRSRADGYRPKLLRRAFERERGLFEHWTHDASLIPMDFYPHWNRRFLRKAETMRAKFERWRGHGFHQHTDALLERIEREGPLRARDLEGPRERSPGGWWNWHDGKAALEYLWHTGRLAVAARDGFQKLYDLPARVVPEPHLGQTTEEPAFVDWACAGALDRLGFATPGDIARYWDLVSVDEAKAWCATAEVEGRLRRVAVEAVDGTPRPLLAPADIDTILAAAPEPPDRIRALSPFDPVIRDRKRLNWLFGFDYTIEVFVPAAKRKYGYYVFPLLEGDRLVGRIDMAADRDGDALRVTALWPEPGVPFGKGRAARLEADLDRLRRFADLGGVAWTDGWRREPLA